MNNIFGENGLIYRVITKLVDLMLLNIIFLITCLPVFTIGAASVSLYTVAFKMCRKEEGYITREYLANFKKELKKPTAAFLVLGLVYAVLVVDWILLQQINPEIVRWMGVILLAVFLLVSMVSSYVFPLMAKFENTLGNTFKNALIISMTRIIFTVPVTCINLIPAALILYGGMPMVYGMGIYVMVGFALAAYVNSFIFQKVFERYVEK